MGRTLPSGSLVRDQLDFYSPPGSSSRLSGVNVNSASITAFFNNSILPWFFSDGSSVSDSSISSGCFWFNEIPGSPGFYSLRFFPDKVGFWRIVVYHSASGSEQIKEYDVVQSNQYVQGLSASFTK